MQERNNEVEPYWRRTERSSLLQHGESSAGRQGVEAEEDLAAGVRECGGYYRGFGELSTDTVRGI